MLLKMLFSVLFLLSFVGYSMAQNEKGATAVAPKDLAGAHANGLLEGETLLKSGKILKWGLIYDKEQKKTMYMNFDRPAGVSEEEFTPVIQAMTIREFWDGVGNCIILNPTGNAAVGCIVRLQQRALSDCITTGSRVDCWMLGQ